MNTKEMKVRRIKKGTVIDHVPPGNSPLLLDYLEIGREFMKENTLIIATDVNSPTLGTKDVVKIENVELSQEQMNLICLVAPAATVSLIRDYEVIQKPDLNPPQSISDISSCPNPNCISNQAEEKITSQFKLIEQKPVKYACEWCKREVTGEHLIQNS